MVPELADPVPHLTHGQQLPTQLVLETDVVYFINSPEKPAVRFLTEILESIADEHAGRIFLAMPGPLRNEIRRSLHY